MSRLSEFKDKGGGIVISTYGLISSDPAVFWNFHWKYLILDVTFSFSSFENNFVGIGRTQD
jgi:hypothetical protein